MTTLPPDKVGNSKETGREGPGDEAAGGAVPASVPEPPEGWKKRLVRLFTSSSHPVRDALSFSTGFASAFLPPFGFHSVLVALLAYLFKLSLPLGLLGSWTNNPWTFIPIFLPAYLAEIKIGGLLLHRSTNLPTLQDLSRMSQGALLNQVQSVLTPFVAGSVLVALIAFSVAFPVSYLLIRWIKRKQVTLPPG